MKKLQAKSKPKVFPSKTLRKIRQVGGTAQISLRACLSLDQNLAVTSFDILVQNHLKLLDDSVTLQSSE